MTNDSKSNNDDDEKVKKYKFSFAFLAAFAHIFIGPESDHWLCLSLTDWLTDWLTHSCLVNLIDVTLVCEDANSKLVEVVTIAAVDA